MQTSVENTGAISRKMTVTVPSDRVQTAVEKRLKELTKTVKIDGFRKGKVPMSVVKSRYADSVYFEVVEKVIDETLREGLMAEKLNPAAFPDISPSAMEQGKDLEFVADFDVLPEFKDINLSGIKVKTATAKVADTDIDASLEQLQKQHITWSEVKRKSKKGDRIIVDFKGSIDGEEFAGGAAQDAPIVLGEGQMLEDFEKGLTGLKGGEETTIKVDFPADYPGPEVAGKKAEFAITVKSVSESELPEVNDEFAAKYNSKDMAALRAEIQKTMESSIESSLNTVNRVRVFDALIGKMDAEAPRKLVSEEIERMIAGQKEQMKSQGMNPDSFNPSTEALEPEAKKRVLLGLVMMQYIQDNEISVDAKRVDEYINKMAASYEDPTEFVNYYKGDKERLSQVESIVMELQVVDSLLENATVEDEVVSAKDLLDGKIS